MATATFPERFLASLDGEFNFGIREAGRTSAGTRSCHDHSRDAAVRPTGNALARLSLTHVEPRPDELARLGLVAAIGLDKSRLM